MKTTKTVKTSHAGTWIFIFMLVALVAASVLFYKLGVGADLFPSEDSLRADLEAALAENKALREEANNKEPVNNSGEVLDPGLMIGGLLGALFIGVVAYMSEQEEGRSVTQEKGELLARNYLLSRNYLPVGWNGRVHWRSWQFIEQDKGHWFAYLFIIQEVNYLSNNPAMFSHTVVLKSNDPYATINHVRGNFKDALAELRHTVQKEPVLDEFTQEKLGEVISLRRHDETEEVDA